MVQLFQCQVPPGWQTLLPVGPEEVPETQEEPFQPQEDWAIHAPQSPHTPQFEELQTGVVQVEGGLIVTVTMLEAQAWPALL